MAETLGPQTELSAVNELLLAIGEQVIASLAGTLPPDANTALVLLRSTSRDLQEEGWQFNSDTEITIGIDGDGYIQLPSDALRVDNEGAINTAWRDGRLYDLDDNTFVFTEALECSIVRHFAFADLPPVARRYVVLLTLEKLMAIFPASDPQMAARTMQIAVGRAKAAFLEAEIENGDYNALSGSLHVSSILRRGA